MSSSSNTKNTSPPKTPPESLGGDPVKTPEKPKTPPKPDPTPLDKELEAFLDGVKDLSAEQINLLKELYVANGQDAYDAEAVAVGRLKQEEYLAIPAGMTIPKVAPVNVGRKDTRTLFSAKLLAAIYHLNKPRAPTGENPILYAMLRLEAVKLGWVDGQKEIVYVPFTDYKTALTTLATDLPSVKSQLDTLRLAAFLIPLVAEHTFRTMGHHYITGLATEYQTRYRKTLKACLAEEIMQLAQPATLFHHVLHWVSPARSYNVLAAQLLTKTLPDALILRANAPPAGWALVTTTAAVLHAMESANILEPMEESFDGDLDEVRKASEVVRSDVRKWHKAYFAYNVAPPSDTEVKKVSDARDIAIAFAPYAQGFIEGTLRDAALGQAQALKKHAELNPVAKARASRFFRALTRTSVGSVADLFKSQLETATRPSDD